MKILLGFMFLVLNSFKTTNSSFLFGRRLLHRFFRLENSSHTQISNQSLLYAHNKPCCYQTAQNTGNSASNSNEMENEIIEISKKTLSQLEQERWSVLMSNPMFYLMTRPDSKNFSLVSYLVIANYSAISPRSALLAYTNVKERVKWDSVSIIFHRFNVFIKYIRHLQSLKELYSFKDLDFSDRITSYSKDELRQGFNETMYYRAKCPWPLSDREYLMSRK